MELFKPSLQETEAYNKKCFQEHGGNFPAYEYRESDAALYLRMILGFDKDDENNENHGVGTVHSDDHKKLSEVQAPD